ncbi:MAG: hypothetical protein NPIRA02_13260 [Nitrospirales bacterium]|nr:MAG: hypothetical protein NPIRA02_13260 [Nitrospirales bacterium]
MNTSKRLLSFVFSVVMVFSVGQAQAVSLDFKTPGQSVLVGERFTVDLTISGLGNFTAPSLGAFDLFVSFEKDVLRFVDVGYGDPILGDQLDISGFGAITSTTATNIVNLTGFVNLAEISLDPAAILNTMQPGAFTLARLSFIAEENGQSPFRIEGPGPLPGVRALGDSFGNQGPLEPITTPTGPRFVNVVPEPGTVLLFGSGLAGLLGWRWKRSRIGKE